MHHPHQENSLSFSNITQTMQAKRQSLLSTTSPHHHSKPAGCRDVVNQQPFYNNNRIATKATRGGRVEATEKQRYRLPLLEKLSNMYEQAQHQIRVQIQAYNDRHQELVEALADMQIRDLLTFNKSIQENQAIYEQLRAQLSPKADLRSFQRMFQTYRNQNLLAKIDKMISSLHKEGRFTAQDVYESAEVKRTFKAAERSSGQSNERFFDSLRCQSGIASGPANSQKSKNSTMEEFRRSAVEDTPESVKSRLSNNCLRLNQQAAVAMFDKIDVCESVDISGGEEKEKEPEERSSFKSLRSRYRYASDDQNE